MSKMFKDKSWNEKTELERFETLVDEFHELLWGTPRRPEKKFEGMMMKVKPKSECKATICCEGDCHTDIKPKRARGKKGKFLADDKSTKDVNEAWEGGKAPKRRRKK